MGGKVRRKKRLGEEEEGGITVRDKGSISPLNLSFPEERKLGLHTVISRALCLMSLDISLEAGKLGWQKSH